MSRVFLLAATAVVAAPAAAQQQPIDPPSKPAAGSPHDHHAMHERTQKKVERKTAPSRRDATIRSDTSQSDPTGTVPPGAPGTTDPTIPGSPPS